jgi:hypothetical protein
MASPWGREKKNDAVLLLLLFGQIQRLYSSLVLILSGNLDYLCAGPSHLLNLQSSTFLSVICTFSLSIDFGSAEYCCQPFIFQFYFSFCQS